MEVREIICGNACCGTRNGGTPNGAAGHIPCARLAAANGVRRMIANGHMRTRPGDCADYWRSAGVPKQAETPPPNGSAPLRLSAGPVIERSGQASVKARPIRRESQAAPMVSRDIGPLVKKASDWVHEWLERRSQRRELLSMSDHMLRDIGISRADAEEEWRKSFWR